MTDPRLELVHELERMDEVVAAALAELDELAGEVEAVRRKALELQELEARLPSEREAARDRLRGMEFELAEAEHAVEEAERALAGAEAQDRERMREAERALTRARDRHHVSFRKREEAEADIAALEDQARRAGEEREGLEERARRLAGALRERPRLASEAGGDPGSEAGAIEVWASRARAALFVARGQLSAERDAVIRQANELAAAVVGEPLTAASTAVVARRVESALGEK